MPDDLSCLNEEVLRRLKEQTEHELRLLRDPEYRKRHPVDYIRLMNSKLERWQMPAVSVM